MRLLVVRHAIAGDRDAFAASGQDDGLRPVTTAGARKMKRGVRGLRWLVPSIDLLAASPLTRAAETAEIIRAEYGLDAVVTVRELAPGRAVDEVARWLATTSDRIVAIVGHEPQLGRLVSFLLAAGDKPAVELKKGAACLLEVASDATEGSARLVWSLPPRVLRRVGA